MTTRNKIRWQISPQPRLSIHYPQSWAKDYSLHSSYHNNLLCKSKNLRQRHGWVNLRWWAWWQLKTKLKWGRTWGGSNVATAPTGITSGKPKKSSLNHTIGSSHQSVITTVNGTSKLVSHYHTVSKNGKNPLIRPWTLSKLHCSQRRSTWECQRMLLNLIKLWRKRLPISLLKQGSGWEKMKISLLKISQLWLEIC